MIAISIIFIWILIGWVFYSLTSEEAFPKWDDMTITERTDFVFFVFGGPLATLSFLLHIGIRKLVQKMSNDDDI